MALEACPKCETTAIFVHPAFAIRFDGAFTVPNKVEAWCNNSVCKQRFWWHRNTEKITRRNVGSTTWREKAHDC